jgi:hypothetical protein
VNVIKEKYQGNDDSDTVNVRLCGKYYYGNFNEKRIQERKENLNIYLQQLLHVQRDILVSNAVMSAFQEFFAE